MYDVIYFNRKTIFNAFIRLCFIIFFLIKIRFVSASYKIETNEYFSVSVIIVSEEHEFPFELDVIFFQ